MIIQKYISYISVLFTILSIVSCTNDMKRDEIRIGFSQCFDDHPFRSKMNQEMRIKASLLPNVHLTIKEARGNLKTQGEDIKKFISDGMDAIIVSAVNGDSITDEIDLAMANNIPVIVLDRKIKGSNFTAYLGADNMEVGENAAKYILSKSMDSVKVIEIRGGGQSSADLERSQGFNEVAATNKRLNIVASSIGDATGIVEEEVHQLFDSIPKNEIFMVYAFSDRMAFEAWSVARELGVERNLRFIGVDGLSGENNGIDLVMKGILEATVLYPTGGQEAIELAVKAAKDGEITKMNKLPSTIIDITNADIMKNQYDKINEHQEDIEKQALAIKEQEILYASQNNLLKMMIALLVVVLSLAIYSVYSIITIGKKNRQLLTTNEKIIAQRNEIERIAKEIKENNEAKFNFFTGLSHEFKTPLTLIMSSIESVGDIFKGKKSEIQNEIELIKNNSNRLLRLMNNLLDFRKSEDQKFNIRASKTNIYFFSKTIFNEFRREAQKRQIQFEIETDDPEMMLFIDRNLMDKVYFNLLSNAFKFTPDNGKIRLTIDTHPEKNYVSIKIKDNGIGIPNNEIAHVFEPFFKGSNNRKNSTGIGLHLSKQFVQLHLGTIDVKSYHGTEFEIKLFKGDKHFNEDQLTVETVLEETSFINLETEVDFNDSYIANISNEDQERYSILIIEDNRDLSQFLHNKLLGEYKVYLSYGPDAIAQAIEQIPDIIICDVNLPIKNGFEICYELKNDLRTSHIPTILLTALSDKESYLKGLQAGADLYLTKPFSYSILIQSIKSLMYNREKLRFYYTSNIHKIEDSDSFGNMEQKFITNLNSLIHNNLANSNFSVENLAESLNVSRVQLYRKVKAIMGISVSDYISSIRLNKAKSLLETTKLSVSEIAYETGFSSPNYFSTAFKSHYGVSPGAFRKSL